MGTDAGGNAGSASTLLAPSPADYGWTHTGGTEGDDLPVDVVIDAAGNVYLAFIDTARYHDLLVKLGADGSTLWTETLDGGINRDMPLRLALDNVGDLYVTGSFKGNADFDPGSATDFHKSTALDTNDAFVTKLHADGSYAWTRTYGEAGDSDNGMAVATDPVSGDVLLTGTFQGNVTFDRVAGKSIVASSPADPDQAGSYLPAGFLLRLHGDGSLVWLRAFPGWPNWLSLDGAGNPTIGGFFLGSGNFDWSGGLDTITADRINCDGYYTSDIFVTRALANGDYGWTQQIPTPAFGEAMTVDSQGNVYVAGTYANDTTFDLRGKTDLRHVAPGQACIGRDLFLTRLAHDGAYSWTYTPITFGNGSFGGIALDNHDNPLAVGDFSGTLDFGRQTAQVTAQGPSDALLLQLGSDNQSGWQVTWGGTGTESAMRLVRNASGHYALLGGFDGSPDFDFTQRAPDVHASLGSRDWFVTTFTLK